MVVYVMSGTKFTGVNRGLRDVYRVLDKVGDEKAIHEHVRDPKTGEKQCYWRRPNGESGLNGTPLKDLPLYGEHELDDEAVLTVVVEGEKARDALAAALEGTGVSVVGTVTGATQIPSETTLGVLQGHDVVLWPDTDETGILHMSRIAEELQGIAAAVRVFEWRDAPEVRDKNGKLKGQDAADHPAVISGNEKGLDRLLNDLAGAPRYMLPEAPEDAPSAFQRVDLAAALEGGVEPPEVLVPDMLLAGKVHCVYSAGGTGKTFYAAHAARRVLEGGGTVVYFDQENGLRIMAERAECLGITPQMAQRLHYFPFPTMPLDKKILEEYEELLDEIGPDLVVFDSWVNLLAVCGLDENSSVDIATWTEAYSQKARHRKMAVLLLDHTTKEGGSARGSGRKLDYVDVMWELKNPQKFDRMKVGRIDLHLRKDREGWLPRNLTFSVGGGEDGFVFKGSRGTADLDQGARDEDGLTAKERDTLNAVVKFGTTGATNREWEEEAAEDGVGRSKYYEAKGRLTDLGLVEHIERKYFARALQRGCPVQSSESPADWTGRSGETVQSSPPPYRGGRTGLPVDYPPEWQGDEDVPLPEEPDYDDAMVI